MRDWITTSVKKREERSRLVGEPCGICKEPMTEPNWDHDAKTGLQRGWTCQACNLILGHAKDSPERLRAAAAYLEKHALKTTKPLAVSDQGLQPVTG